MTVFVYLALIWAQNVKPVLLVRTEETPFNVYQAASATQIFYRTPQQLLPELWQKNRLTAKQIEIITNYMKTGAQKDIDPAFKEQLMKFPISYETFALINRFNQTVPPTPEFDPVNCELMEKLIKKLRSLPGGEDAVVLVNGKPWRCHVLEPEKWAYVIVYSSAWAPHKFFNRAKFITTFLEFFRPDPWVKGKASDYEWTSVADISDLNRSILWPNGQIVDDNWINEYKFGSQKATNRWVWVKWGLVFSLGVLAGWLLL